MTVMTALSVFEQHYLEGIIHTVILDNHKQEKNNSILTSPGFSPSLLILMEPELVTRCHRRTKNFILEKIPEKISQPIYNVEYKYTLCTKMKSHI